MQNSIADNGQSHVMDMIPLFKKVKLGQPSTSITESSSSVISRARVNKITLKGAQCIQDAYTTKHWYLYPRDRNLIHRPALGEDSLRGIPFNMLPCNDAAFSFYKTFYSTHFLISCT